MKKLLKLSIVLTLFFSITACDSSIDVPQIGQSQSSLVDAWASQKVGKIDKDSFPNVWILKKYHMMVEFDEADMVKHFAICRRYDSGLMTVGYDVLAKKSNTKVVYHRGSQYRYVTGWVPTWTLGISEEEAEAVVKAFEAGSKEYNKPESILDKKVLKKTRIRWWEYVLDLL